MGDFDCCHQDFHDLGVHAPSHLTPAEPAEPANRDAPDAQLGEAGPYAVHYTRECADGTLRSMQPTRNLGWPAAVRVRDRLLEDPATRNAHISADTCG